MINISCLSVYCIKTYYFNLQAKYHAEFEKTKGKLTQVADDPETLRMKANSKIIR